MAFTLARCVDDKGKALEGSRGLSMFFLETRKEGGELNNIHICKLKVRCEIPIVNSTNVHDLTHQIPV